ncbi:hypothetical protein, partial [Aneurinibacillus thermoaerophilus]|uniref:hypothetical protein n=1 Tax=Aneurinibacillus thermoaerophilus TaxID=143495 RepID=UPI002E1CB28F|nr:hypothetical protein [Aneurinibacillus thermoaerophilus]
LAEKLKIGKERVGFMFLDAHTTGNYRFLQDAKPIMFSQQGIKRILVLSDVPDIVGWSTNELSVSVFPNHEHGRQQFLSVLKTSDFTC